ncbi:MAG: hypothetical protein H6590_07655 [Flavobacteriales bacterium]|nr:hypothetical protein [Flavobacteriales bacterium]
MKDMERFDELARRKLEERRFAFDEADWQGMERMLHDRRRKRGGLYWSIAALLLLLIGAGIWRSVIGHGPSDAAPAKAVASRAIDGGDDAQRTSTFPKGTAMTTEEPATSSIQEGTMDSSPSVPGIAEEGIPTRETTDHSGPRRISQSDGTRTTRRMVASPSAPGNGSIAEIKVVGDTTSGKARPEMDQAEQLPTEGPDDRTNIFTPEDALKDDTDRSVRSEEEDQRIVTGPTEQQVIASGPLPEGPVVRPDTARVDQNDPTIPEQVAQAPDSNSLAMTGSGPRSPWELSVLGGLGATINRYGGAISPYAGELRGARSTSLGAEMMKMSAHIGWGAGIHCVTYAEHLDLQERFTESTELKNTYSLVVVDTTVIGVVDTIQQGGVTYYVTSPIDTSMLVLDTQVDTITHHLVTLERRARSNVISYLELPLLFDVHTDLGRWSLGLRGGPTLGLLIGRRGELPNERMDAYEELQEQSFRSFMVGAMLRGYVRYHFAPNWSVGLEPTYRALILDTYADDPHVRRTSAVSGLLSISYRLH